MYKIYMERMILLNLSQNLTKYRSEIILLDYQNNYVEHSNF